MLHGLLFSDAASVLVGSRRGHWKRGAAYGVRMEAPPGAAHSGPARRRAAGIPPRAAHLGHVHTTARARGTGVGSKAAGGKRRAAADVADPKKPRPGPTPRTSTSP